MLFFHSVLTLQTYAYHWTHGFHGPQKYNQIRNFTKRGVEALVVPWDYDFTQETYDGLFIRCRPTRSVNALGSDGKCLTTADPWMLGRGIGSARSAMVRAIRATAAQPLPTLPRH